MTGDVLGTLLLWFVWYYVIALAMLLAGLALRPLARVAPSWAPAAGTYLVLAIGSAVFALLPRLAGRSPASARRFWVVGVLIGALSLVSQVLTLLGVSHVTARSYGVAGYPLGPPVQLLALVVFFVTLVLTRPAGLRVSNKRIERTPRALS